MKGQHAHGSFNHIDHSYLCGHDRLVVRNSFPVFAKRISATPKMGAYIFCVDAGHGGHGCICRFHERPARFNHRGTFDILSCLDCMDGGSTKVRRDWQFRKDFSFARIVLRYLCDQRGCCSGRNRDRNDQRIPSNILFWASRIGGLHDCIGCERYSPGRFIRGSTHRQTFMAYGFRDVRCCNVDLSRQPAGFSGTRPPH